MYSHDLIVFVSAYDNGKNIGPNPSRYMVAEEYRIYWSKWKHPDGSDKDGHYKTFDNMIEAETICAAINTAYAAGKSDIRNELKVTLRIE